MLNLNLSKQLLEKLQWVLSLLRVVTFLLSIVLMGALIYDFGFYYSNIQQKTLNSFYHFVWIFYIIVISYRVFIDYIAKEKRGSKQVKIAAVFLYLSLLPYVVEIFVNGTLLNDLLSIFQSRVFFLSSIIIFALTSISSSFIRLVNNKTNPATIMAISFLAIIMIGTGLLQLPRCYVNEISFLDSLFISTSAVCVTGLTPLDISSTFTIHGQIVILSLIQIGGLGVMTLTSFFALFFMGNTNLYSQLAIKDMISSDSLNSLLSTLLYILGFSIVIELCGMAFIWSDIHGHMGMSLREEFFFSLFHSVSAFCNAGFSTMSGNLGNAQLMYNHNWFYIVICTLIVLGGIGFPILVNFRKLVIYYSKQFWNRFIMRDSSYGRQYHITSVNSKIVIVTTVMLIILGTASIAILEWNNSLKDFGTSGKIVQSLFNAVSPRTAGFTSIDLSLFGVQSLLIYIFLMWIGGAAQSTAGGIKVNVFAVSWFNLKSIIKGESRVNVFGREISELSIRRANATVFVSLITLVVFIFAISVSQPQLPLFNVVFECFSAFGTVGSSLNTTSLLNDFSKSCIIVLMFAGRVGITTLLMSLVKKSACEAYKLPQEQIIIN